MAREALKSKIQKLIETHRNLTAHGLRKMFAEENFGQFTAGAIIDAADEMVEAGILEFDETHGAYFINTKPQTKAPAKTDAGMRAIQTLLVSAEHNYHEGIGEAADAIARCRRRLPDCEENADIYVMPAIELEAAIREAMTALEAARDAIARARHADERAAMLNEISKAFKK